MKTEILLELADKWIRDVKEEGDQAEFGDTESEISNARRAGGRSMKEKLASQLRELASIMG